MSELYIKDGKVQKKSQIVIYKNGRQIYNAPEEMLLEEGWTVYSLPTEEQYKQRIVDHIRSRYSINDEIAILRQRDSKSEEFAEYNSFAEHCKKIAYNEIYGENEL